MGILTTILLLLRALLKPGAGPNHRGYPGSPRPDEDAVVRNSGFLPVFSLLTPTSRFLVILHFKPPHRLAFGPTLPSTGGAATQALTVAADEAANAPVRSAMSTTRTGPAAFASGARVQVGATA